MKQPLTRLLSRYLIAIEGAVTHDTRPGVYFLLYHKVAGELSFEMDLPFTLFRRQMEYLASTGRILSYESALGLLQNSEPRAQTSFVLTFDDGFSDLYSHAFPLLQSLQIPFTVFITTGFIEEKRPYVLSRLPSTPPGPLSWKMLEKMLATGLVTIGAHTHTHPELTGCSDDELQFELNFPRELIRDRLGIPVDHFAYPRARWDERVENFVKPVYRTAAIAGWKRVKKDNHDPYRIERVPILKRDGWLLFLAKTFGWMEKEERLYR